MRLDPTTEALDRVQDIYIRDKDTPVLLMDP